MTSIAQLPEATSFLKNHQNAKIYNISAYMTNDSSFYCPIGIIGTDIRGICPLNIHISIVINWMY